MVGSRRLLLIDRRLEDWSVLAAAAKADTEVLAFDFFTATYESLLRGRRFATYDTVGIVFHNPGTRFQFLAAEAAVDVGNGDHKGFLLEFLKSLGSPTLDLLSCELWASPAWREFAEAASAYGLVLRGASKPVGAGNWILDSHGVDVGSLYFTEAVKDYRWELSSSFPFPYETIDRTNLLNDTDIQFKKGGTVTTWGNYFTSGNTITLPTTKTPVKVVGTDNGRNGVTVDAKTLNSFTAVFSDNTLVSWGNIWTGGRTPENFPTGKTIVDVYSNLISFTAYFSDGSLFAWGCNNNRYTELNIYTTTFSYSGAGLRTGAAILGLPTSSPIQSVITTRTAYAALLEDGRVFTWGDTEGGHLGSSPTQVRQVPLPKKASALYANDVTFMVVLEDGTPYYTGYTKAGVANEGIVMNKQVQSLCNTTSSFLFLWTDGTLFSWGDPSTGGCGVPTGLPVDYSVRSIHGNDKAFCVIMSDGTPFTWGALGCGAFGPISNFINDTTVWEDYYNNNKFYTTVGAFVAIPAAVSQVSVSNKYFAFILDNQTAWGIGDILVRSYASVYNEFVASKSATNPDFFKKSNLQLFNNPAYTIKKLNIGTVRRISIDPSTLFTFTINFNTVMNIYTHPLFITALVMVGTDSYLIYQLLNPIVSNILTVNTFTKTATATATATATFYENFQSSSPPSDAYYPIIVLINTKNISIKQYINGKFILTDNSVLDTAYISLTVSLQNLQILPSLVPYKSNYSMYKTPFTATALMLDEKKVKSLAANFFSLSAITDLNELLSVGTDGSGFSPMNNSFKSIFPGNNTYTYLNESKNEVKTVPYKTIPATNDSFQTIFATTNSLQFYLSETGFLKTSSVKTYFNVKNCYIIYNSITTISLNFNVIQIYLDIPAFATTAAYKGFRSDSAITKVYVKKIITNRSSSPVSIIDNTNTLFIAKDINTLSFQTLSTGKTVKSVTPSFFGFAAICLDGSIYCYGNAETATQVFTSPILPTGRTTVAIYSSEHTFTALLDDNSLFWWGFFNGTTQTTRQLTNLTGVPKKVVGNGFAYAAITADDRIFTWGDPTKGGLGGETGAYMTTLTTPVKDIVATRHAFTAILADGRAYAWGDPLRGGLNDYLTKDGVGVTVKQVVANMEAFAAVLSDSTVLAWGDIFSGGVGDSTTRPGVPPNLIDVQVTRLYANNDSFAALIDASDPYNAAIIPMYLEGTNSGTQTTIKWFARRSTGVTFTIFRSTTLNGSYEQIGTVDSQFSFVDTTVKPGRIYYYYILGNDGTFSGIPSTILTVRPTAITINTLPIVNIAALAPSDYAVLLYDQGIRNLPSLRTALAATLQTVLDFVTEFGIPTSSLPSVSKLPTSEPATIDAAVPYRLQQTRITLSDILQYMISAVATILPTANNAYTYRDFAGLLEVLLQFAENTKKTVGSRRNRLLIEVGSELSVDSVNIGTYAPKTSLQPNFARYYAEVVQLLFTANLATIQEDLATLVSLRPALPSAITTALSGISTMTSITTLADYVRYRTALLGVQAAALNLANAFVAAYPLKNSRLFAEAYSVGITGARFAAGSATNAFETPYTFLPLSFSTVLSNFVFFQRLGLSYEIARFRELFADYGSAFPSVGSTTSFQTTLEAFRTATVSETVAAAQTTALITALGALRIIRVTDMKRTLTAESVPTNNRTDRAWPMWVGDSATAALFKSGVSLQRVSPSNDAPYVRLERQSTLQSGPVASFNPAGKGLTVVLNCRFNTLNDTDIFLNFPSITSRMQGGQWVTTAGGITSQGTAPPTGVWLTLVISVKNGAPLQCWTDNGTTTTTQQSASSVSGFPTSLATTAFGPADMDIREIAVFETAVTSATVTALIQAYRTKFDVTARITELQTRVTEFRGLYNSLDPAAVKPYAPLFSPLLTSAIQTQLADIDLTTDIPNLQQNATILFLAHGELSTIVNAFLRAPRIRKTVEDFKSLYDTYGMLLASNTTVLTDVNGVGASLASITGALDTPEKLTAAQGLQTQYEGAMTRLLGLLNTDAKTYAAQVVTLLDRLGVSGFAGLRTPKSVLTAEDLPSFGDLLKTALVAIYGRLIEEIGLRKAEAAALKPAILSDANKALIAALPVASAFPTPVLVLPSLTTLAAANTFSIRVLNMRENMNLFEKRAENAPILTAFTTNYANISAFAASFPRYAALSAKLEAAKAITSTTAIPTPTANGSGELFNAQFFAAPLDGSPFTTMAYLQQVAADYALDPEILTSQSQFLSGFDQLLLALTTFKNDFAATEPLVGIDISALGTRASVSAAVTDDLVELNKRNKSNDWLTMKAQEYIVKRENLNTALRTYANTIINDQFVDPVRNSGVPLSFYTDTLQSSYNAAAVTLADLEQKKLTFGGMLAAIDTYRDIADNIDLELRRAATLQAITEYETALEQLSAEPLVSKTEVEENRETTTTTSSLGLLNLLYDDYASRTRSLRANFVQTVSTAVEAYETEFKKVSAENVRQLTRGLRDAYTDVPSVMARMATAAIPDLQAILTRYTDALTLFNTEAAGIVDVGMLGRSQDEVASVIRAYKANYEVAKKIADLSLLGLRSSYEDDIDEVELGDIGYGRLQTLLTGYRADSATLLSRVRAKTIDVIEDYNQFYTSNKVASLKLTDSQSAAVNNAADIVTSVPTEQSVLRLYDVINTYSQLIIDLLAVLPTTTNLDILRMDVGKLITNFGTLLTSAIPYSLSLTPQVSDADAAADLKAVATADQAALLKMREDYLKRLYEVRTKLDVAKKRESTEVVTLRNKAAAKITEFEVLYNQPYSFNVATLADIQQAYADRIVERASLVGAGWSSVSQTLQRYTYAVDELKRRAALGSGRDIAAKRELALMAMEQLTKLFQTVGGQRFTWSAGVSAAILGVPAQIRAIQREDVGVAELDGVIKTYQERLKDLQFEIGRLAAQNTAVALANIAAFEVVWAQAQSILSELPDSLRFSKDMTKNDRDSLASSGISTTEIAAIAVRYADYLKELRTYLPTACDTINRIEETRRQALASMNALNAKFISNSSLFAATTAAIQTQFQSIAADVAFVGGPTRTEAELKVMLEQYVTANSEVDDQLRQLTRDSQDAAAALASAKQSFISLFTTADTTRLADSDLAVVQALFAAGTGSLEAYLSAIDKLVTAAGNQGGFESPQIKNTYTELQTMTTFFKAEWGIRDLSMAILEDRDKLGALNTNIDSYLDQYRTPSPNMSNYAAIVSGISAEYRDGIRVLRTYPLK